MTTQNQSAYQDDRRGPNDWQATSLPTVWTCFAAGAAAGLILVIGDALYDGYRDRGKIVVNT